MIAINREGVSLMMILDPTTMYWMENLSITSQTRDKSYDAGDSNSGLKSENVQYREARLFASRLKSTFKKKKFQTAEES